MGTKTPLGLFLKPSCGRPACPLFASRCLRDGDTWGSCLGDRCRDLVCRVAPMPAYWSLVGLRAQNCLLGRQEGPRAEMDPLRVHVGKEQCQLRPELAPGTYPAAAARLHRVGSPGDPQGRAPPPSPQSCLGPVRRRAALDYLESKAAWPADQGASGEAPWLSLATGPGEFRKLPAEHRACSVSRQPTGPDPERRWRGE